jgi:hypothetical protein
LERSAKIQVLLGCGCAFLTVSPEMAIQPLFLMSTGPPHSGSLTFWQSMTGVSPGNAA